jgi:hypothetical protein
MTSVKQHFTGIIILKLVIDFAHDISAGCVAETVQRKSGAG